MSNSVETSVRKASGQYNLVRFLVSAAGMAGFIILLNRHGGVFLYNQIFRMGPAIFLVVLLSPVFWALNALAWRALMQTGDKQEFFALFQATAAGNAVNALLPVLSIGGDVAKGRMMVERGMKVHAVVATLWVDKGMQAVTMLLWAATGLGIWAYISNDMVNISAGIGAMLVLSAGIGIFVALQFSGPNTRIVKLAEFVSQNVKSANFTLDMNSADRYIKAIYQSPCAIFRAIVLRYAGRAIILFEIIFVGVLAGISIPFSDGLMIAGLVYAARGLSFAVPARIGTQEGGYIAAGAILGYSADVMLLIALTARLREVASHLPILALWYYAAVRRWSATQAPR